MLVSSIRTTTTTLRRASTETRVLPYKISIRHHHDKPNHSLFDSLANLFEKMMISGQKVVRHHSSRTSGIYIQRRSYTVQYRNYISFKPQVKMDWGHLDEDGKIKESILDQRKQFLKDNGLLEDCFNYKERLVYANKHLYDVQQKDSLGRSNLERMRQGYCPVDKSGQDIIIIHHFDQTMQGPWVILNHLFHQNESSNLHSYIILKDKVIREQFNLQRQQYWKFIAAQCDISPIAHITKGKAKL